MSRLNNYEVTLYCNNQLPVISVAIVTTCFCSFINIVVTTKCLAVILVVIVIVYLQQRVSVV